MADGAVAAVRQTVTVPGPPERAFRLFTEEFGSWWPKTHSIASVPVTQAIIEPRTGGRCYDLCADGSEVDWGRVLECAPPRSLVLAWQVNGQWRHEPDPERASRVTVTFTPARAGTQVELIHDQFDRHGPDAEQVASGVGGPQGWPGALHLFAATAAR